MKPAFYYFLLGALLTVSCRESKPKANARKLETDTTSVAEVIPDTGELVSATTAPPSNQQTNIDELLSQLANRKKEVEEKLSIASKTEADGIYDAYTAQNEMLIGKIISAEGQLLDKFYVDDAQVQRNIKKLGALLDKYELEYDELGEGVVEIKTKNDFYYDIFKNYVSDDYRGYIAIKSEEDKVSYSADAALQISFREIGERVIVWEKLLAKYPTSKLKNKMKDQYQSYQSDYLVGMDNTSTIERPSSGETYINTENLDEFNRFMKKYPSSPTNRLIKFFLKNFKEENIHSLIDSEQRKL